MTLGTRSALVDASRPNQLRSLLAHSLRFGALSLPDAAMAEASIASHCGGPGFALRLASLENAPHVALVRSCVAGRRGAILHAFVILDRTSGHQADWVLGDVHGILTLGDAARRWSRAGGSLAVDRTPDDVREPPGHALTAAVARRLPWLSGLVLASGGQPASYAVRDLARIGRIIQRCPEASIESRLQQFDRSLGLDGPGMEGASGRDFAIASSVTSTSALPRGGHDIVRRAAAYGRSAGVATIGQDRPLGDDHQCGGRP